MRRFRSAIALTAMMAMAPALLAQDKKAGEKPLEAFTDPAKAGEEFQIQGEYEGEVAGKGKVGAQVVALDDGAFDVHLLEGGLPGAGWNQKTRLQAAARSASGKTVVSGDDFSGEVASGVLSGKTADGHAVRLEHVVRKSSTEGAKPPQGALVLFDGSNADAWIDGALVEGNLLRMGVNSKQSFGDCKLHVEFRLSFMPRARGQARSNSGVYLQGRYEVQVLDSFGLGGENNECGAIYGKHRPIVNMCFPPLSWQTLDVEFKMPRFDASGKKIANARMTVLHNGVKVQDDVEVDGPTASAVMPEDEKPGPLHLQDHGNPVYYRNIWIVETRR